MLRIQCGGIVNNVVMDMCLVHMSCNNKSMFSLTPNVCAVYTEEEHRKKGLAGKLLNKVVDDMANKGVATLYLVTDHIGFYERYGWEFVCMVQGDGEPEKTRMYIHR